MKAIKKEKYRLHYFNVRNVEVTCIATIIILENMFGDIKISCFYLRENRGGENALLSLHVCKCSTSTSAGYKILIIRKSPSNNTPFVEKRRMNMPALTSNKSEAPQTSVNEGTNSKSKEIAWNPVFLRFSNVTVQAKISGVF